MKRLNVGCGRNVLEGWINVDAAALPGVDIVADLEQLARKPLPLEDSSVSELLLSHVLEHIREPLPLMQELWRVAAPGARMTIRVPYGSSDDAYEDPTHARRYFADSFGYFGQPAYWRADYGYRGDWQPERVVLSILPQERELTLEEAMGRVRHLRNVVEELVAELSCVKPARAQRRELHRSPVVELKPASGQQ